MTANGRGRKLQARSDTERVDLLVKLLGFGRSRNDVSFGWGSDGRGPLDLHAGPAGNGQKHVADDAGGDIRALLDRALSKNAGAKKRARRRAKP